MDPSITGGSHDNRNWETLLGQYHWAKKGRGGSERLGVGQQFVWIVCMTPHSLNWRAPTSTIRDQIKVNYTTSPAYVDTFLLICYISHLYTHWHAKRSTGYLKGWLGNTHTNVSCVLMARQCELWEMEWGLIVGVRWVQHSISKAVQAFNIPQSTVSCTYQVGIRHVRCYRPQWTAQWMEMNCDLWHLAKIVHANNWLCQESHPHSMQQTPNTHIPILKFPSHDFWHVSVQVQLPAKHKETYEAKYKAYIWS